MLKILAWGYCSALPVLHMLQPAMAWQSYFIDESCCCEAHWDCCEELVIEDAGWCCEGLAAITDDCGCSSEIADTDASGSELTVDEPPQAASAQKITDPAGKASQPMLEDELPPAPINVPSVPADTTPSELFPGPAAETSPPAESTVEETSPAEATSSTLQSDEPAEQPRTDTSGLFDEPTGEAVPDVPTSDESAPPPEAPANGDQTTDSSSVDDVFGEPTPSAADSSSDSPAAEAETVEGASETEDTDSSVKEADPLDDLFGPSSSIEGPGLNHDAIAPLRAAGGLASGNHRRWSDPAGNLQCHGRLIRMTIDGVYVAKPNGKLVAIAFSRLSDADLVFVRSQVRLQRALLAVAADVTQVASHSSQ